MEKSTWLTQVFIDFKRLKVLIIGDVMIDAYLWGKVDRISPEAPVPIVALKKRENRLGGAANVALNIQSLGATPLLCSMIGNDTKGNDFFNLLQDFNLDNSGIFKSNNRITTTKFRIIGNNAQMLRVDEEIDTPLLENETNELIHYCKQLITSKKIDVIIFEDYDKGVITENLITQIVEAANNNNIPTVVDPKRRNFLKYQHVSLFKPNLKELREGLKVDIDIKDMESIAEAGKKLHEIIQYKNLIITLSEHGIYLMHQNKQTKDFKAIHKPAFIRNIADVSGAGDTVISVVALCEALNIPMEETLTLANLAGGLVCEEIGVVPIDKNKLFAEAIAAL